MSTIYAIMAFNLNIFEIFTGYDLITRYVADNESVTNTSHYQSSNG